MDKRLGEGLKDLEKVYDKLRFGDWILIQMLNSVGESKYATLKRVFKIPYKYSLQASPPVLGVITFIGLSDQATRIEYVVKPKNAKYNNMDYLQESESKIVSCTYWGTPIPYILGHWSHKPSPKELITAYRSRMNLKPEHICIDLKKEYGDNVEIIYE